MLMTRDMVTEAMSLVDVGPEALNFSDKEFARLVSCCRERWNVFLFDKYDKLMAANGDTPEKKCAISLAAAGAMQAMAGHLLDRFGESRNYTVSTVHACDGDPHTIESTPGNFVRGWFNSIIVDIAGTELAREVEDCEDCEDCDPTAWFV